MNHGRTVFSQLTDGLPKYELDQLEGFHTFYLLVTFGNRAGFLGRNASLVPLRPPISRNILVKADADSATT